MKIGFVLDDSLDKTDGVQQYVLTLGHWLKSVGHEVHYLAGHTERTDLSNVHSLSKNVTVHFNQNRMSTPLPSSRQNIKSLLAIEKFDVLHVQMPYSPFLAGRIIKLAPKTTGIVGTFHIIPFSTLERTATHLLGFMQRASIKKFDKVVAVSSPAVTFARRAFKVNASLLPNVVNVTQFHGTKKLNKYNDGKINIVFLGRLVERKGCHYLLKALERLHQEKLLINVRVLICGKGPMRSELEAYVKKHHLGSIVHFIGFISEADKPKYLGLADIAVFPSTGGESFGIVLIEAMAAGSGVVLGGNNIGYNFVLKGQPKLLFDPKDTASLSQLLKRFILKPQERQAIHDWQNKRVNDFDVRYVGPELLKIYEQSVVKN